MDISFLSEYMIPVIVGICLCYIPTICAALGVALACWMNWPEITATVILSGLASGLASTGLHQAFKQILEGFGNGK